MNNLNNKQRLYLLCLAMLVLAWFAYRFAFAQTMELSNKIEELNQKIEVSDDAPIRLQQMESRLQEMDGLIGREDTHTLSSSIVEVIGPFCAGNGMILREIPEYHLFQDDQFKVLTCQVVVEGRFKGLVNLLDVLERDQKTGKLRSCSFAIEPDLATGERHLIGTYYLQVVGQNNQKDKQ